MRALVTNIYSEYSLLQSTNRIDELVSRAAHLGYEALALTDKHVLYGCVPFFQACQRAGVKPLLGLEVSVSYGEAVVPVQLVAKNEIGYAQLRKFATELGCTSGVQALSLDHFQQGSDACFIFIGERALGRDPSQWWQRWCSLAQTGHAFFAARGAEIDQEGIAFAKEKRLPIIAAPSVRFLCEQDEPVYQLIREMAHDKGENKDELSSCMPSQTQLTALFPEELGVLAHMKEIAVNANVTLKLGVPHLPTYDNLSTTEAMTYLKQQCARGVNVRYGQLTKIVHKRLAQELRVIEEMGYASYFLIVADFVGYARQKGMLVGPGRGSAAGSLVAYVLMITDVDPLAHGLMFERFLNRARATLPDIDIDFPDYRREEIIAYVRRRFGKEKTAQIVTFGTFAARAAIRAVGKAQKLPDEWVGKIAKAIVPASLTIQEAVEKGIFRQYECRALDELLYFARQIEGLPRHVSVHAAGVIIDDRPLVQTVALQKTEDGQLITQADMYSLNELGLMKFDLLGLRNLTLLEQVCRNIEAMTAKKMRVTTIPLNDQKTFAMLREGRSTGVFQLESTGMRQTLKQLGPTEFADIVATSALYRPGPMEVIPTYIAGKKNPAAVTYIHEDIAPILSSTYGVIVYQEQIMQLVQVIGRYTLGEADIFRRAVSKKQQKVMEEQRGEFIRRAQENGYSEAVSCEVFAFIERFARYGFVKSHAVAYSFISYWLAYLKVHYTPAFYAALLSSVWQNHAKLYAYINEAKRDGLKILPPSVHESDAFFTVQGSAIRFGLLPIAGVSKPVVSEIISCRKKKRFEDLFDFYARMPTKVATTRVVEALIKSGAFDEFEQPREVLLANMEKAETFVKQLRSFEKSSAGLFTLRPMSPGYTTDVELDDRDYLSDEREVLGFYLSGHPLENEQEKLERFDRVMLRSCRPSRETVRIAAWIRLVRQITTKSHTKMAFVQMSDESDEGEAVIFPTEWEKFRHLFVPHALLFMEGVLEERKGKKQFVVQKALDITLIEAVRPTHTLYIRLPQALDTPTRFSDMTYILQRDQGTTPVILYREQEGKPRQLEDIYRVAPKEGTLRLLKQMLGEKNVVLQKSE
ncbi:DNA polymerase III subunit alpha [Shouchella lonarensis]|uniref:DNA polymerase III subunit alpha n=1 Tax=Shouchella lonarensis TaxID=1464122 RepID=A0A1G6GNA1_9BACI|nr:DNA polymerase III subunit alpha [Shouchella lonarensis]SDB83441.1 DNA polymerase-3 subunit alpha [Shouchella lonarensis]